MFAGGKKCIFRIKYGKHLYKFSRFMDVEKEGKMLFTLTSIYIITRLMQNPNSAFFFAHQVFLSPIYDDFILWFRYNCQLCVSRFFHSYLFIVTIIVVGG